MNGRLYFIIDRECKKLRIVTDVESVGEGRFLYTENEVTKVAMAQDILMFTTREEYKGRDFDRYCNDLGVLLDLVCKNRFNLQYQKNMALRVGDRVMTFSTAEEKKQDGAKRREKFTDGLNFQLMSGEGTTLWLGTKGDIIASGSCSAHVEWNKHLNSTAKGMIKLIPDVFSYVITYVTDVKKPGRGYSQSSDYIASFISAFPDRGVTYKEIMQYLNMEHPSVAGRISDMNSAGRIVKKDTVKGPHGTISYWIIKG